MREMLKLFLPIEKVDDEQRMVWGFASTPTRDLDDEIVDVAAIKAALPDYMTWGNIREMHQPSAVGVTKEASVDHQGLYIGAHIVDDAAWKKVKEGVYKGFSIGGRVITKVGDNITKLRMTEISLVDRPANPDARIDVIKIAGKVVKHDSSQTADLDAKERGFIGRLLQKLMGSSNLNKDYNPDEARDPHGEWTSGGQSAAAATPQGATVGRAPTLTNHPLVWALGASALGAEIAFIPGGLLLGALTAAGGWGIYIAEKLLQNSRSKAAGGGAPAIEELCKLDHAEIARRAEQLSEDEKERLAHLLAMHMTHEQIQGAYDRYGPGKKENVAGAEDLAKWDESQHPRGEHGRFGAGGEKPVFGPGGSFIGELTHPNPKVPNHAITQMGTERLQGAGEGTRLGAVGGFVSSLPLAALSGHPGVIPAGTLGGAAIGAVHGFVDPEAYHRLHGTGSDWDAKDRVEHGPPADLTGDAEGDGTDETQKAAESGDLQIGDATGIIARAQEAIGESASKSAEIDGAISPMDDAAIDLEDDLDQSWSKLDDEGELSMSADATELAKRTSAVHKMSIMKAAQHMAKADDCHAQGMSILQKCHGMMSKAASKAEVMDMVKKAHGCFAKGSEHMDIAQHHIEKVASSFGSWGGKDGSLPNTVGGEIDENSQGKMTEGKVPDYPVDTAYPGKAAMISVSESDALKKAAVAEAELKAANAQIDLLSRLPAGPARARAFAVNKSFAPVGGEAGEQGAKDKDPMSLLMKGVEVFDLEDPDQRQRASARAFGNMIINPDVFAKSITDPRFRGQGGQKAA